MECKENENEKQISRAITYQDSLLSEALIAYLIKVTRRTIMFCYFFIKHFPFTDGRVNHRRQIGLGGIFRTLDYIYSPFLSGKWRSHSRRRYMPPPLGITLARSPLFYTRRSLTHFSGPFRFSHFTSDIYDHEVDRIPILLTCRQSQDKNSWC